MSASTLTTGVWLLLMLATATSTWGIQGGAATSFGASALIMLIAGIKARLVIIHFMDLGHAPWPWRLFFEAWWVVVTAMIVAGFWLALPPTL